MGNASEVHKDMKNITLQMGGLCDGHLVVTDSLHLLLVIHTLQEDGIMMKAHVVLSSTFWLLRTSVPVIVSIWQAMLGHG
jgi:hypothetical protein